MTAEPSWLTSNIEPSYLSPWALFFYAPLASMADGSKVLHATDVQDLHPEREPRVTCRCGAPVTGVLPTHATIDGVEHDVPVLWPPRVADLTPGVTLCRPCLQLRRTEAGQQLEPRRTREKPR